MYNRNAKYYIEKIYYNQFSDLQIFYIIEIDNSYTLHEKLNKNLQVSDSVFEFIFKAKISFFYLLSFVFVLLVVIRCHSMYNLLSLDVPVFCVFINNHLKSETV